MTSEIRIETGEASCLGTAKLLLVNGELDVVVGFCWDLLILGSNVDCSGRSGKTIKGENKAGEYLVYSRVLCPATKQYAIVSKWKGRLYSGLQDRNTRVRGNNLGLSKTSIFRRVLQHGGRINQQFKKAVKVTMKQKLLQHCIIVSCNNYQCF